jgi:hypothetical protein
MLVLWLIDRSGGRSEIASIPRLKSGAGNERQAESGKRAILATEGERNTASLLLADAAKPKNTDCGVAADPIATGDVIDEIPSSGGEVLHDVGCREMEL